MEPELCFLELLDPPDPEDPEAPPDPVEPVPVLAVSGVLLFAAGWVLNKKEALP